MNAAPIPIPRARTGHGNHVPLYNNFIGTWGAYYRPNVPRSNAARNSKTRDKVKALQVAVFVAMPSEDRERQQHDAAAEMEHDALAIGIAEVPWLKGDLVSDGD
ncbi:hypothetical protein PHLCEN_2v8763 [Hermanssonia centrifuga]|uniref:Uncharacterized protein n=1 Tax=Hermanssonia centrifuga TaxID=98765 RepID=A0A2R6NSQ8_9APHY|nr:hypothetical protein PHLCEN_2v8763 [Hermanssonia centrifuga]